MKLRRNFLVLMAVSCMALSLAGCGNSSDNKKVTEITTAENIVGENTTETSEQASDFDFNQVFDHVEVNGKYIPFPFTLNDLGDGFEVRAVTEMGDGRCCGTLYYDDESVAGIYMKIDDKNKFNNDTEISMFDLSNYDKQVFKINGIDCGDDIYKVKENIIGLDEIYKDNILVEMEAWRDENTYIMIFVEEDESIRTIYLGKGE